MGSGSRIPGQRAHGGVLLVPARVNGQDFDFLLDTGSAFTGLSRATVTALGLAPKPGATRRIALANGGVAMLPMVVLPELRVGGHAASNLAAMVLDLTEELRFRGILVMDFLGRFRVTIEPDTATLVLRPVRHR